MDFPQVEVASCHRCGKDMNGEQCGERCSITRQRQGYPPEGQPRCCWQMKNALAVHLLRVLDIFSDSGRETIVSQHVV